MATDDIYNNKKRYVTFLRSLDEYCQKPKPGSRRKFWIKNPTNKAYFVQLSRLFEAKDISFVRRLRLFQTLKLICHATNKDLKDCTRDDINKIVGFMHTRYKSPKSKRDFILDLKYIWKSLFPVVDERGLVDEAQTPYVVRHLKAKIDKSKERLRNDKLTFEELQKIVTYFSRDPRIQAFIMLAFESLGRPQEILYLKLKDVELYDNFAKLWISEHGKEGVGLLQCIDSYPYLIRWLNQHPLRGNPNAFLFITLEGKTKFNQLKPKNINKKLRQACEALGIPKQITCYSLKRNGVTFRRLNGESDVEIQHAARWTSSRQLKTYDLTEQEEALKIRLIRKGLLEPDKAHAQYQPKTKTCLFCGAIAGFTDEFCPQCKRPLDRKKLLELEKKRELMILNQFMQHEPIQRLFKLVYKLQKKMAELENPKS